MKTLEIQLDDRPILLETGHLARQAAGAVMARSGDAAVLATVTIAPAEHPTDHLPLMTDYRERSAAAGRIPGNYLRREIRQGEHEILISRLIDRSIRPLLPADLRDRIHVVATLLSEDPQVDRAGLALTAVGAALLLSPLPFRGPLVGGRILGTDAGPVSLAGAGESGPLDLTVALNPDGFVMIEGACDRVDDGAVLTALFWAQSAWAPALSALRRWDHRAVPPPPNPKPAATPRVDGRAPAALRPLSAQTGLLPSNHGSALFTRGGTQALVSATLGTARDGQDLETLGGSHRRSFLLHYNFPGFAVGQIGGGHGPGRRELGHGDLARRALVPALPDRKQFAQSVRLVSDILESDGSSSMATVCGASLALIHAGVPLQAPVVGVAMGAGWAEDRWQVLTDITAAEDAQGAMDFKVAGTADALTALQLDNKVGGLPLDLIADALSQARAARQALLAALEPALAEAAARPSPHAPFRLRLAVPPDRIGVVIGAGGKRLQQIQSKTGAQIEVRDDGTVLIQAPDETSAKAAQAQVEAVALDLTVGGTYQGQVTRHKEFGLFVRIGTQEALVHQSELGDQRPEIGDGVVVRILGKDSKGRLKLSLKAAAGVDPAEVIVLG